MTERAAVRVSYLQTMRPAAGSDAHGELVQAIDKEGALVSEARIATNTAYLLRHFDQATMRKADGTGFTSILATDGIPAARRYYKALQASRTRWNGSASSSTGCGSR